MKKKTCRFSSLKTWIYFWFFTEIRKQKYISTISSCGFTVKSFPFHLNATPHLGACSTFHLSKRCAVFLESKRVKERERAKKKNPIVKLKVQCACMNNNGNYAAPRAPCGSYEMCNYVKILVAHANCWNFNEKSVYEWNEVYSTLTTVRHTQVFHRIQLVFQTKWWWWWWSEEPVTKWYFEVSLARDDAYISHWSPQEFAYQWKQYLLPFFFFHSIKKLSLFIRFFVLYSSRFLVQFMCNSFRLNVIL